MCFLASSGVPGIFHLVVLFAGAAAVRVVHRRFHRVVVFMCIVIVLIAVLLLHMRGRDLRQRTKNNLAEYTLYFVPPLEEHVCCWV